MALVLAVMMVLGATTAMAATIKVNKADPTTNTHTYTVYQIFKGTVDGTTLNEITYGTSHPDYSTAANANNNVPKSLLDTLTTEATVRDYVKGLSLGTAVGTVSDDSTSGLTVDPGYYVLKDTSYTGDANDAYSAIIVQIIDGEVTLNPKKQVPSVDKEVKDEADDAEAGSTDGWGETADHEIGESFQFKVTATIPAGDYSAYTTYKAEFKDTMSTGITFEKIDSVKIAGETATGYTTKFGTNGTLQNGVKGDGSTSWTLTFANVPAVAGQNLTEDVTIEVIYSAHLNSDAQTNNASGSTTNENSVSFVYSNNPDATGSGDTGETPEDHVWVFTYESDNTKVDANDDPVAGAKFKIFVGSTTGTTAPTDEPISLYKVGTTYYVGYTEEKADDYPTGGSVVTEMETTADTGKFDIKGLDVGTYTLFESHVPDGYVQATNTVFTISATHSEVTDTTNNVVLKKNNVETKIEEKVVNLTGATLPSTGGIGTTMFYVGGGLLALIAVVLLVTKRRVGSAE